jgi:hypothetical protein
VTLAARPFHKFDAAAETIDLSGRTRSLALTVFFDK